jgi:ribosomal protein S18 acetylase RimI-like enzyme
MPNHEAVQLVPGTAGHRSAIAELVWSTGPSSYSYIFGARGVFDAFVERSWLAPGTYFGHSEATVALCDGRVAGIEIGFTGRRNYEAKDNLGAVSAGFIASGIVTERDLLAILTRAERASYLNPFVPAHAYYVLALAVVPAMRGTGLGARLLANAMSKGRAAGCRDLHLDVLSDNDAVGFYRARGLETACETIAPEPHGAGVPMEMRMTIPLAAGPAPIRPSEGGRP